MSCSTYTQRDTFVDGERYGQLTNLCGQDDAHTPVVGSTCLHVLIHVLIDIWDDIKWMEDGKRYFRENIFQWRHTKLYNTNIILLELPIIYKHDLLLERYIFIYFFQYVISHFNLFNNNIITLFLNLISNK